MRGRGAVLAGVLACACGSDDDGVAGAALRVIEVTPADGATEVELDAPVTIVFNHAIDPSTVDGGVYLYDLPAEVSVDDEVVTLTPRQPFEYLTLYNAVVTTELRDLSGGALEQQGQHLFTSRPRRWSRHVRVGTASEAIGATARPRLASTPGGRVVAVWQTAASPDDVHLFWSAYDPATGAWRAAEEIAASSRTMEPLLASDADGRVLAVWLDLATVRQAWLDPVAGEVEIADPIHSTEALLSDLALAMSPSGNAAVAFGGSEGLLVARYSAATAEWSAADVVDPVNSENGAVAVADSGQVMAAWSNLDGNPLQSRWFDGAEWRDAEPLWSGPAGRIDRVRLEGQPNGGVIAAWGVIRADGAEVHSRFFYRPTEAWSEDAVVARPETAGESLPELAGNDEGRVFLFWVDWNGGLFGSWFHGEWEYPAELDASSAPEHPAAVDPAGNAITVYGEANASYYRHDHGDWIASQGDFGESTGLAVAFSGSDPIALGAVEGAIRAAIYR